MSEADSNLAEFVFDEVTWRLKGWKQVDDFVSELQAFWQPFDGQSLNDPTNVRGNVNGHLNQLANFVAQAKARGETPAQFAQTLHSHLHQQWGAYHPDGKVGTILADIAKSVGAEAVLFAYSLVRRVGVLANAQTIDHLRGAMMLAFPTITDHTEAERRLAAERANFRNAVRSLNEEVRDEQEARKSDWHKLTTHSSQRLKEFARRRTSSFRRRMGRWKANKDKAISDIHATDHAFKELMHLKAPADYWTKKAESHRADERIAVDRVVLFFRLAIPAMVLLFGLTAWALLEFGDRNPPSGLYVIAGAGLATTSGLLFWVGRLLTKLYLSQHHLRQDAEERAVMTTTYLALTAEQATNDADRQIILGALFRATSDGIVREEGTLDANLPALISRLASR
jgi:hypothetical protein